MSERARDEYADWGDGYPPDPPDQYDKPVLPDVVSQKALARAVVSMHKSLAEDMKRLDQSMKQALETMSKAIIAAKETETQRHQAEIQAHERRRDERTKRWTA